MNAFPPCTSLATELGRREWLRRSALGFGSLALHCLLADGSLGSDALGSDALPDGSRRGGASTATGDAHRPTGGGLHHRARAKRVIFLYMDGGPSQVDTFDPKPMLDRYNGQDPKRLFRTEPTQFNDDGRVLASPWRFRRWGESGLEVSDLFPHVAAHCADELAVVRSMISEFSEHTFANYFLHTGSGLQGRPSMGAWVHYGLGSVAANLPGFVVLNGGLIPPGGLDCFGSGFLPASHQASVFLPRGSGIPNVEPPAGRGEQARLVRQLASRLDQLGRHRLGQHDAFESAITNFELAAAMQTGVPELMRFPDEPEHIRQLYGLEAEYAPTRIYAAQCLLARRLVERGVRFIELTCPQVAGDRWDQHSGLKAGHENNARAVDQPIAGLLRDLKQRGLLSDTLVVWAGEFGRTPFAQGSDGRDHNPFGFSIWMAGGGVRGGQVYGRTDEWGYRAIENRVEIHDLHATMLHLLGVAHTRSTFRFGGRDMRLTDVKGHVLHRLIA
jgi:hypothetical protein